MPATPPDRYVPETTPEPGLTSTDAAKMCCAAARRSGSSVRENRCQRSGGAVLQPDEKPLPNGPGIYSPDPPVANCRNCLGDGLSKAAKYLYHSNSLQCLAPQVRDCLKKMLGPSGNPTGFQITCADLYESSEGAARGCTNCNGDSSLATIYIDCAQIKGKRWFPKQPFGEEVAKTILHELIHACFCEEFKGIEGKLRADLQNCGAHHCLEDCLRFFKPTGGAAHEGSCKSSNKACNRFVPLCGAYLCYATIHQGRLDLP